MGVRGMKGLQRKVQRMKRDLGDEVEDAVESGARRTAAEMQRNVAQKNTVWRGNLYRAIRYRKQPSASYASFIIEANTPYAGFVEFGTGARGDQTAPPQFRYGSPSPSDFGEVLGAIVDWVETKPVFFGPRTFGVATAIAERIVEQGTHAHPFMRPAWFKQKPAIKRDAGYAVRRVVARG